MIMPVGVNCGFEFEKGMQLLVCFHNKRQESVRSAATTKIDRPLLSVVVISRQFHPALRKFSMMFGKHLMCRKEDHCALPMTCSAVPCHYSHTVQGG